MLRLWRLITLLFTALSAGMAFCHLLQLPPRMGYNAARWRTTQSMYQFFGPPVGAIIEGCAWLMAVGLAFFVRKRPSTFCWTMGGTLGFVLAQVAWWLFVIPVNQKMAGWTPESMPADWKRWRAQWEYTHALRAVLQIGGLLALIQSILVDTRQSPLSKESQQEERIHSATSSHQAMSGSV